MKGQCLERYIHTSIGRVRRFARFASLTACAAWALGSCVSEGSGTSEAVPELTSPPAPVSPAPAPVVSAAPGAPAASASPSESATAPAVPTPAPARIQLREESDLTPGYGPVTAQAWRRDGETLLTADFDRIQRWEVRSPRKLGEIAESGGLVVDFSLFEPASGKARLAVASRDGTVAVWDPDDGTRLASVPVDADCAAWSPDGSRLAVCRTDGRVLLLDWPGLKTAAELPALPGEAPLRAAWLPSGKELVLGGASGIPARWKSGEPSVRPLGTPPAAGTSGPDGTGRSAIRDLDVSPDGSRVAAAGSDGTVTVTHLTSGAVLLRFPAHRGAALCVAWSPDGSRLATGGEDRQVRVWSASDGTPNAQQHHNSLPVRSVAWRPGGGFLSSGAGSMDLRAHTGATILWQVP